MCITSLKTKTVEIKNVADFASKNLLATVKIGGHWVPFEKRFPIVML